MANKINVGDVIAKESLSILENTLVFAKNVNREYKREWAKKRDFKIGDKVTVTKPARFTVRNGKTAVPQDYHEEEVLIKLDTQDGVDVAFDSAEITTDFDIDRFSEKVLEPQVSLLANTIDLAGLRMASRATYNAVGIPGTTPNALKTYLQAGAKMSNFACPTEKRGIVLNPMAQVEIVDSLKGLVESGKQLKSQYENGYMTRAAGFDWAMSQNIPLHTTGAQGGTPLVKGAAQSGSSIVTDGWSNSVTGLLKEGDVFTMGGVFAVNPITKQSTGELQQFVVLEDVNSSGAGEATIPVSPALILTGPRQTVTAAPADNAPITVLGASSKETPVNLAYHRDAFTLVTAELPLPKGMDMVGRAYSEKAGIGVRFVRGFDIINDRFISRLDVLYGWAPLREEWACRIHG